MKEFFIVANSFAAPVFSDSSTDFVKGKTPKEALEKFAAEYNHPAGLYSAGVYNNANDYHKGQKPLAKWLSNHEIAKQKLTDEGGYSYLGNSPGNFEMNGKTYFIDNPKGGRVVQ